MGAISMNLPMIYQKSVEESREFFDVLDEYMQLIRGIHRRTYNYLCKLKASCNPLAFMEGGFDGGNLKADDTIEPVLKYGTLSFAYGGLNELSLLAIGKPNHEDPSFAIKTMEHINKKVDEFKKKDKLLYAIYGTPGESWLPLACNQFVAKYGERSGIIEKDHFLSNSFHTAVTADISPIEKMELEAKFWNLSNGGKISHILVPDVNNTEGIISLIRYGMSLGLYLGVNHRENHCCSCGEHWAAETDDIEDPEKDVCPVCGSPDIVKVRRM